MNREQGQHHDATTHFWWMRDLPKVTRSRNVHPKPCSWGKREENPCFFLAKRDQEGKLLPPAGTFC